MKVALKIKDQSFPQKKGFIIVSELFPRKHVLEEAPNI